MLERRPSFCLLALCTFISLSSENVLCDIPAPWTPCFLRSLTSGQFLLTFHLRFVWIHCEYIVDYTYKSINYNTIYPKSTLLTMLFRSSTFDLCHHLYLVRAVASQHLPFLCKSPWISSTFKGSCLPVQKMNTLNDYDFIVNSDF